MRALLVYLAAAPRFSESRRRLASLLWGSSAEEQARQSLRQLLSNFRRLPEQAGKIIVFDDEQVRLDPEVVAVDRDRLINVPADADVSEVAQLAALYRDDLGTGLDIGESDFDAWLHQERARSRDTAISVFDRLIRGLAQLNRHQEALTFANRLAAIDPLREETHRLVIEEEAIVSGRASAMMRYERFRVLLREELGVHPEPATLRLIDQLRQASKPSIQEPDTAQPAASVVPEETRVEPSQVSRKSKTRWRPALAAAIMVGLIVGGGWIIAQSWNTAYGPVSYVGEGNGRASVVVLPFESSTGQGDLNDQARAFESEGRLAVARSNRLSIVDFPENMTLRNPAAVGRALRVRYVVKTRLAQTADGLHADVSLFDSETSVSVWSAPMMLSGQSTIKFAREFFRSIYAEIAIHRAKALTSTQPDSIPALLWRAEASRIRTRVGESDPAEITLFEAVLARDPDQLYALLGLSDCLILRVARVQSPDRKADIQRAETLLTRAREQAPNLAEVAFSRAMLNKLQGRFEQAAPDFERAFYLDRTHWNAAAQSAHVKIFLGRFDEAYEQMEAAVTNLLPDIGAAETAYIAGETALVAGHADRAVAYLDMAIAGNGTISRIHALYAAALEMAGRHQEAHAAAVLSQQLKPVFTVEMMARRGGPSTSPLYKAARDKYVAAFRTALVPSSAY
ncbi:BTAD domain-containing putative transcriptional regulator [Bradyrhizobium sp. SYSU BS000235]|uniref:BTAD domain-containing putative transcriptional regulator n=1 Tax=Bradyrhizobium sp. SYSU BS000235 TaxID=3411332 RepID=UPI003C738CEC